MPVFRQNGGKWAENIQINGELRLDFLIYASSSLMLVKSGGNSDLSKVYFVDLSAGLMRIIM